ncbi:MAG: putative HTH-type transcriptional regulator YdcH [Microbacteriaceae bacterium]|jgi:DNA-binding MarR family transcriptional regulator|nr:putative HTH-type transcriptional regulator YdcH [Microbacteriaceae bacterium]
MTEPPAGPLASPGYWLRRAAQRWRRELGVLLRHLDLTPTQFDVIAATSWLGKTGSAPTQQEIAEFSGNDRMMTSKVLRGLEARGLVARRPEGRVIRLSVTPSGREVVTAATAIARGLDADFFSRVSRPTALREELRGLVGDV